MRELTADACEIECGSLGRLQAGVALPNGNGCEAVDLMAAARRSWKAEKIQTGRATGTVQAMQTTEPGEQGELRDGHLPTEQMAFAGRKGVVLPSMVDRRARETLHGSHGGWCCMYARTEPVKHPRMCIALPYNVHSRPLWTRLRQGGKCTDAARRTAARTSLTHGPQRPAMTCETQAPSTAQPRLSGSRAICQRFGHRAYLDSVAPLALTLSRRKKIPQPDTLMTIPTYGLSTVL
jgi:hypothetical protein